MANAVVTGRPRRRSTSNTTCPRSPTSRSRSRSNWRFKPRMPADALELEIGDMPGISIDGERARRDSTRSWRASVQMHAYWCVRDAAGLFYFSVVAKMVTQVQTEARAFSVPVVVGTVRPRRRRPLRRRMPRASRSSRCRRRKS